MRKLRHILPSLLLFSTAYAAFAAPKLADYPLRVQIFKEHWGTEYSGGWGGYYPAGYHGYGDANVTDGDKVNGMKFVFECSDHFTASDSDEAYPARWRKPGQEIELIAQMVGSSSIHKCIMKTTLKENIYYRNNGELVLLSQDQYQKRLDNHAEKEASLAPADVDPTHYPLKFTLLDVKWGGRVAGIYSGQGQGNIETADGLHAVDFSIHCISQIPIDPVGRYYRARWTEDSSKMKMTLLLHKMSDPSAAATCNLDTRIGDDVYIRRSSGDLQAVTLQEYKNFEHAAVAGGPGQN